MDLTLDASGPGLALLAVLAVATLVWVRLQGRSQRCPSCGERVRFRTSRCPHCSADLA